MPNYIYDLPPMANGTAEKQLQDLRAYLQRMSKQLNMAQESITAEIKNGSAVKAVAADAATAVSTELGKTIHEQQREQQRAYAQLKELIIKTADDVQQTEDKIETELKSNYVAQSSFGEYQETVETLITQTAKKTVEGYKYQSKIDSLRTDLNTGMQMTLDIEGRITRGFIELDGVTYFGLAISDNLRTTTTTLTENEIEYTEIDSGQSFGLYTAHGWLFILNGARAGWFSAEDNSLHVADILVESSLRLGNWMITSADGFGIRYVGG